MNRETTPAALRKNVALLFDFLCNQTDAFMMLCAFHLSIYMAAYAKCIHKELLIRKMKWGGLTTLSTTDCILSQKIESMNELCVSSKKEFMKLCSETTQKFQTCRRLIVSITNAIYQNTSHTKYSWINQ